MKRAIFFCFIIILISCTKEKPQLDIMIEENKQDEIKIEKVAKIFYDSYEEYLIAQYNYNLIENVLKYYLENHEAKIMILEGYHQFYIINDKMFFEEVIPSYENIPEHNAIEVYDIHWEEIGYFTYVSFNYNGKLLGNNIHHGYKRYLLLYENHGRAALYDQNNDLSYLISSLRYTFSYEVTVQASSELNENNITYGAKNCIDESKLTPWVENSFNNGTGEHITFIPEYEIIFPNIIFYISNGYIDYNKNYLYEYNNRIKKIRVSNIGKNEYFDFEINDTPNYQIIYVHFENKIDEVSIEMLEVYQGEKYNDLCINLLKPYYF